MGDAVEIPLRYWADPQGDSVVVYSSQECHVFRGCWTSPGEPADYISCLTFHGVKGVRCFPREFSPYTTVERTYPSSLLSLADSDMLVEYRAFLVNHYPHRSVDTSNLRHFVIDGHDFYHEILAVGFTEQVIYARDITEPRLRRLLEEA